MPIKEKPHNSASLWGLTGTSLSRSLEFLKYLSLFKVVPIHMLVYCALIYFRMFTST